MFKKLAVCSRSFSKHPFLRSKVLEIYPGAKFNDKGSSLSGDSLVEFLKGFDMAITALEIIDETILSQLPELKIIGKYGVGLDMIDLEAMQRNGVKLGWTGGVNKRSVSELVLSHMIALLHRVPFASQKVQNGEWCQIVGKQLSDCTVGIVGCGHIGKDLIQLLRPFNCNILVNDILKLNDFCKSYAVQQVSLHELIVSSDVVTLHLPFDSSTQNILNSNRLSLLKQDAILINLARGGLVDEKALIKLLKSKKLSGAALDVFKNEPLTDFDFLSLDNVIITPHIGGSTKEAIVAMGLAAIDGLKTAQDAGSFKQGVGQ